MRVESHVDPERARSAAVGLGQLAEASLAQVRAGSAVDVDALAMYAIRHATLAAAAGETAELPDRLRLGAQATAALFSLARTDGGPLDAPVGADEAIRLDGRVDLSTAHAGAWLQGCWSALAVRDLESTFLLAATPTTLLRASVSRADEHAYRLVDALRGYVTGDPGTEELLVDALEATDPDAATVAGPDFALDVRTPQIEVALALVDGDGRAFGAALAKALELHRTYWSARGRGDDPDGAIALGLLAQAAEARDRGLALDSDSPYLPAAVLDVGPPESVTACPYCVTPIAARTAICPACLEDTTRDAAIELAGMSYRAQPRRPCGACGFRVPEPAVRCPACRERP